MNDTRNFIPRAGLVLLAALAVWPARADYPSSVLALSPLGYWRFDEPATSPPLNTVANSSPLGSILNGYVVGTVVKGEPGVVGKCVRIVNAGQDYTSCPGKVDVPYNAAINPKPPFSVEFWAKPNSLFGDATGSCPLSNFDPNWDGGGNRSGWLFYVAPTGVWNFRLGTMGGYAGNLHGTSGSAAPGVWQHIVATWDGATANLYANGALISSGAVSVTNWTDNSESFLRIGGTPLNGTGAVAPANSASSTIGNRGWDGWVDGLAIYPAVLPASTIAAHYMAATTNSAGYDAQILGDGPSAYWNLDEPAVTPPDPSTFTYAANSGSLGSAAAGTNQWGTLAAQPGPGYAGFAPSDKSVFFDGDNGYFQVNDAPGLHFTGDITLLAWIKPTEQDFFRDIIAHGFDENDAETFLRISRGTGSDGYGDGNYYEMGASDGQTYYDSALFPIPPGDIGHWVFVAGTYDGANWNLYRNGVLVAQAAPSTGDTGAFDVTNRWTVGSRSDPGVGQGQFFGGWIDEPAIFNTALLPSDIYALYNAAQVPPVITSPLLNPGTVFVGSPVTFSVWAEGSPTLSYSWTLNGASTGVTTTNFTAGNLTAGNATVTVVVKNPYGSATNSVSFAVVTAPPSILQPPAPETRFVGYPFSFSVTAGGTAPLTYYWMLGGTAVQAGPSPTYSGTASLTNAGNYSVIVSNVTGINATSSLAALTVLPVPAGYAGTVLASQPMAYWRLDEASGTIAHDDVGGHDGTYYNVTLGVPGYSIIDPDTAAQFGAVNSYVGDISGTAIDFTGHKSFTLEAWVNGAAGQPDQSTIIAKGIGANGTTETEQFSLDVAAGVYRFFTSSGTAAILDADAGDGPNDTWQHVVGVYDDAGGTMYIYVNGQQEGSHSTRAAGLVNTTTPISIGSKRTGNDPNYDGYFTGTIDEVAIYNHALDAATIQAHYAAAYGTSLKPFINIQPQPLTNYVTLPAVFSVGAAGSVPLAYQWKFKGADIAGATDSAYTNSSIALSDAGLYSVSVSNTLGGLVSSNALLTVLAAPTSTAHVQGLVLHLPFDNSLSDATGRGNNGMGYHSTTNSTNSIAPLPASNPNSNPNFFYTDGMVGNASLHYSTSAINTGGSTSIGVDDYYVSLGVRPDLQFSSNVSFTVSFWIRLPLGYTGGDLPFFTDAIGSEGNAGFVFAPAYGYGTASPTPTPAPLNYGGWAYTIYDAAGNGVRIYGDLGSVNDGNWHHLVYVISRVGDNSKVYLDGVLAHSTKDAGTEVSAAGVIDTGKPAIIGQDPTGLYGETGSADIDDLGVWRRALTPLEAAEIFMAANSGYSFADEPLPPFSITAECVGKRVTLNWPANVGLVLQSAGSPAGPYTDIIGAAPPFTVTATTNMFYRARY